MIPAEGTDRIDDFINLLQGFNIHEAVEFLEVAGFVIDIDQRLQKALGIVGIVCLLGGFLCLQGG